MPISKLSGSPITITTSTSAITYDQWVVSSLNILALPVTGEYAATVNYKLSRTLSDGQIELYGPSVVDYRVRNVMEDFPQFGTALNTLTQNVLVGSSARAIIR